MSKTVQAIRIFTKKSVANQTAIGLYRDSTTGASTALSAIITDVANTSIFAIGQLVSIPLAYGDTVLRRVVNIDSGSDTITIDSPALSTVAEVTIYTESELRWSAETLTGTTRTYCSDIIGSDGIGDFKQSTKFENGGAPVRLDGFDVLLVNTTQLNLRLKELGIDLDSCICELREFEGDETDSDSVSEKLLFTGEISETVWSEIICDVSVRNDKYKRNVCIATTINNDATNGNYPKADDSKNGEIIPATYGKFFPDAINTSDRLRAKAIRVSEKQTTLTNDDGKGNYYTPRGMSYFPIVGTDGVSPFLTYYIQLGTDLPGTFPTHIADFVGKYIQVVVGGSSDPVSLVGKYRKISAYDIIDVFTGTISLTLDSFFEKDLSGNSDADADNQAWIKIVDIPIEHLLDDFPCQGFLDEAGTPIAENDYPWLAVYDSATGYVPLPNYGFTAAADIATKASLKIDIKQFEDDPTKLQAYSIFPVNSVAKLNETSLAKFGWTAWNRVYSGDCIFSANSPVGDVKTRSESGSLANITDRDDGTNYYSSLEITHADPTTEYSIAHAFSFKLPLDKLLFEYDSYYLGVNLKVDPYRFPQVNAVRLYWERFLGGAINLSCDAIADMEDGIVEIDDLPDYYYLTRENPDNNKNFYFSQQLATLVSGHTLFPLTPFTKLENLKTIINMFLIRMVSGDSGAVIHTRDYFTLRELALICKKSFTISDAIYANFGGRIFNDTTFAARYDKLSTDIINSPAALLEHICRLENYTDIGDNVNIGKVYSPNALINTDTFDALPDELRGASETHNYEPTFQIFDKNKAYTEKLKTDICKQFYLCTYYDNEGKSCVSEITELQSPTASISLTDIVGEIGEVQDPVAENIYCSPVVNYCYDSATSSFSKILQVLNPQDAEMILPDGTVHAANSGWEPAMTPGFKDSDGESIWIDCHRLFLKYKQIEQQPSDMTDCYMIASYSDALAKITKDVDWMGKRRVSFNIPYGFIAADTTKAIDWNVSKRIKIVFPHQTNSNSIECVIESILKSKKNDNIFISVVLLQDIDTSFYRNKYQNTIVVSGLDSWQDVANSTGLDNNQDEV